MEQLKFDSKPDYLSYLEGLVGRTISEIVKIDNYDYNFKIDENWFNLSFYHIVGSSFSEGECLVLKSGHEIQKMESICLRQFKNEQRVYNIFKMLNEVYVKQLVTSNERTKVILEALLELLNNCDYIEKYSPNQFMIVKSKNKYCFIRTEDYSKSLPRVNLKVKKIVGDNEKIIDTINEEYEIISILNFLEFVYYSSRLKNIPKTKNIIDRCLNA